MNPWIVGVAVFLAGVAVGQTPAGGDGAVIALPVQEPREESLTALVFGELVLEHGCLRIYDAETQQNYLPLWPTGYTYRASDGNVQILDETGGVVAQVSDRVEAGGGEAASRHHARSLLQEGSSLPKFGDCPGPYWVMGEGFERAEGK